MVGKLDGRKDTKVAFDQVLAIGGDKIAIGNPLIDKAKITAKILDIIKNKKISVVKFKSKSRYLKTYGHRRLQTKVLIEKIQTA